MKSNLLNRYGEFEVWESRHGYCSVYFRDAHIDSFAIKEISPDRIHKCIRVWIQAAYNTLEFKIKLQPYVDQMISVIREAFQKFNLTLDKSQVKFELDPFRLRLIGPRKYEVFLLDKYVQSDSVLGLLGNFEPSGEDDSKEFRIFLNDWLRKATVSKVAQAKKREQLLNTIKQVEHALDEM